MLSIRTFVGGPGGAKRKQLNNDVMVSQTVHFPKKSFLKCTIKGTFKDFLSVNVHLRSQGLLSKRQKPLGTKLVNVNFLL